MVFMMPVRWACCGSDEWTGSLLCLAWSWDVSKCVRIIIRLTCDMPISKLQCIEKRLSVGVQFNVANSICLHHSDFRVVPLFGQRILKMLLRRSLLIKGYHGATTTSSRQGIPCRRLYTSYFLVKCLPILYPRGTRSKANLHQSLGYISLHSSRLAFIDKVT